MGNRGQEADEPKKCETGLNIPNIYYPSLVIIHCHYSWAFLELNIKNFNKQTVRCCRGKWLPLYVHCTVTQDLISACMYMQKCMADVQRGKGYYICY